MKRVFLYSFLIFSLAYIASLFLLELPYPGDFLVKSLPVLSLAGWAWISLKGKWRNLLVGALIFSAGGDISLAMIPYGMPDMFLAGLGSFLIAHVIYVVLFLQDRHWTAATWFPAFTVIVLAGGMTFVLFPNLGEMTVPVLIYISVIATMGVASAWNARGGAMLFAGALSFMASDSLIAVNKFLLSEPLPAIGLIIITTYYLAQYLLTRAVITSYQN